MATGTATGAVAAPTRGLGDVLIEMGAISPATLEGALARQREEGGRLGEPLQVRQTQRPQVHGPRSAPVTLAPRGLRSQERRLDARQRL